VWHLDLRVLSAFPTRRSSDLHEVPRSRLGAGAANQNFARSSDMRAESDRSGAMFLEVARDGSGGRDESRRARQHQIVEKIERCPVAAGARDIRAGSKRLLTAR